MEVEGLLAGLVADHLPRAIWPINDQWQIDRAFRLGHAAMYPRDIGFLCLAFFELQTEVALRMR